MHSVALRLFHFQQSGLFCRDFFISQRRQRLPEPSLYTIHTTWSIPSINTGMIWNWSLCSWWIMILWILQMHCNNVANGTNQSTSISSSAEGVSIFRLLIESWKFQRFYWALLYVKLYYMYSGPSLLKYLNLNDLKGPFAICNIVHVCHKTCGRGVAFVLFRYIIGYVDYPNDLTYLNDSWEVGCHQC